MKKLVTVVIDGGPGTGKTSIINELKKKRYPVMPEEARMILARDKRFKGETAVQASGSLFQNTIWDHELKRLNRVKKTKNGIVFFDRGYYDGFVYMKLNHTKPEKKWVEEAKKVKYNKIFMINPLPKKFYHNDGIRAESYEKALKIHQMLVSEYKKFGYKIINVPFDTVENRTNFIISKLI